MQILIFLVLLTRTSDPPPPQKKTVNLCKILNNVKVRICKHLISEFKVNKAFRQGETIALLLFNVVLETATRRPKEETQGTIFDKCSQIMA